VEDCQQLEPTLIDLASLFADIRSVVIAKMDVTENDIPDDFSVIAYPTVFTVPAANGTHADRPVVPIKFEPDRQLGNDVTAHLAQFIREHASLPIDDTAWSTIREEL
jgi:thiol-disulfide isomerase/thioredoxin